MTLLQEATLNRLWDRYQRRFGEIPPINSASIDDAIALLRRRLQADDGDDGGGPRPGGMAAGIPGRFFTSSSATSQSALR